MSLIRSLKIFSCRNGIGKRDILPILLREMSINIVYRRFFQVSLGDWDLGENAKHILDTRLVTVADVITHPGEW